MVGGRGKPFPPFFLIFARCLSDKFSLNSILISLFFSCSTGTLVPVLSSLNAGQNLELQTRLPSLGDVIQWIPFLPIEINVPDTVMSVYGFFTWIANRRPQEDQSTPRIYFINTVPYTTPNGVFYRLHIH